MRNRSLLRKTREMTGIVALLGVLASCNQSRQYTFTPESQPTTNISETVEDPQLRFAYPQPGETIKPERQVMCRYRNGMWIMGEIWTVSPRIIYTGDEEIVEGRAFLSGKDKRTNKVLHNLYDLINKGQFPGLSVVDDRIVSNRFNPSRTNAQELKFNFPFAFIPGKYEIEATLKTTEGNTYRTRSGFTVDFD